MAFHDFDRLAQGTEVWVTISLVLYTLKIALIEAVGLPVRAGIRFTGPQKKFNAFLTPVDHLTSFWARAVGLL